MHPVYKVSWEGREDAPGVQGLAGGAGPCTVYGVKMAICVQGPHPIVGPCTFYLGILLYLAIFATTYYALLTGYCAMQPLQADLAGYLKPFSATAHFTLAFL